MASRRKAEELILQGRVIVNGAPARLGDKADPKKDRIEVDGKALSPPSEKIYLALHKPRGFVTTLSDERDRRCVAQLVEDLGTRVYPVGRLDKDSEGLLLMTNDGDFANAVAHPARHVAKTYRVTVRPAVREEQLASLRGGMDLDGRRTAPAGARVLEEQPGRVVLEIVLTEGRNREIRRMCEALGLEVARLKRVAIGPVRLGMLPRGSYRPLTGEEIAGLLAREKKQERKAISHDSGASGQGPRRRGRPAGRRGRPRH